MAEILTPVTTPDWVFDAYEDDTQFRTFYVTKGLGSGGTYGSAIWHYLQCLKNIGAPLSWSIAPTYQQIADTLLPTYSTVLQEEFQLTEGIDFEVISSQRPKIILKKTKQEIHFKSANRADRLVGPSISHASGTEPGLWKEEAFQKTIARIRHPKAKTLQRLFEGTPEGMGNAYELRANFPEGVDEKKNAVRIILHTEDNETLPAGYIQSLTEAYESDPAKLESYLRGIFTAFTKGTAYWEYRSSRNVALDAKITQLVPIIFCWDLGVSPLAWVAMQHQPHQRRGYHYNRYVAVAEGSGRARGVYDATAEFIATFDPKLYKNTPIEIDGGHDGHVGQVLNGVSAYSEVYRVLKKYYSRVSITAGVSAPDVKDRLEQVNRLLLHELFVVAPQLKNLRKSLESTSLKEGTWELDKKKNKDHSHFADAPGYPLYARTAGKDLLNPFAKRILGTSRL